MPETSFSLAGKCVVLGVTGGIAAYKACELTSRLRKAGAQVKRGRRLKRGGERVFAEADLALAGGDADFDGLTQVVGPEPTPEFAAMVAEQYRLLLDALGDDALRQVAVWRMDGYANDEIADRNGVTRHAVRFHFRNIYRKLGARNRAHAVHIAHHSHILQ